MANFNFLLEKSEYNSFAQACVNAESIWKDSPSSCVSSTRSALEGAIKWMYRKDSSLHFTRSTKTDGVNVTDLFDRMESESFKNAVPQQIWGRINQIRRLANKVLHENYPVTSEDAMRCLHNLFDFVNWLDSRYGMNHVERIFSRGSVPTNPSTFKTILKYVGTAVGGAAALMLAAAFADGNKGDRHT